MKPIRMDNRFGRRFIRLREFMNYARELGIFVDHPAENLFEFLDREGMLQPVVRVRFPPEIARRFEQEKERKVSLIAPVEGDTPRLQDAADLYYALANNTWASSSVYGDQVHPLDALDPKHAPSIEITTGASAHVPWNELKTPLWENDNKPINDGRQYAPFFYHYWQVFLLASLMRTGVKIIFNPEDEPLADAVWKLELDDPKVRGRLRTDYNLEGRHEAREILEFADEFNAVAYFEAYFNNARNALIHNVDKKTGRFSSKDWKYLRAREKALAVEAMTRYSLSPAELLKFIERQCDWWSTATDRGPKLVADEYKRNIASALDMYFHVTGETFEDVLAKVGSSRGYFKPILKVIFPSWIEEQRELAELSLENWVNQHMTALPKPFAMTKADVSAFCDWIDANNLHQIYWQFSRLIELGRRDDDIHRAALAAEVVGLANLAELVANVVAEEHKVKTRGATLRPKLWNIASAAKLQRLRRALEKFHQRTGTGKSTLKRRLAQIKQIKRGGKLAPVLRALLSLQVIRNEGSHLGLVRFDADELYDMVETMVVATLMIWRMR